MSAPFYDRLDHLLRDTGQATPCLVLDLDRFQRNIALVRDRTQPGVGIRVVAKSLACQPLLDQAYEGLNATGLMTFSVRMLERLLGARPQAEQLMGKPLPVQGAAQVLSAHAHAAARVIWLIDTEARAAQYAALAETRGQTLRVALELDVGLHRGGVPPERLADGITALTRHGNLRFEGVMGYEPHLAKLPGPLRRPATRRVVRALQDAAAQVKEAGGTLINTAGSMTFAGYGPQHGVSEVSLGSVLVKPTDFDMPSTEGFEPALFIATPILKYMPGNPLPGLDWLPRIATRRRAHLAVYGGYWKAQPVHPAGYGYSGVFGHSSNQEVWTGPVLDHAPVDHFAILRPTQSEAVLPEFGEVVVVSQGRITDRWPTMPVAQ